MTDRTDTALAEIIRLVDQGTDPADRHPFIDTALEMLAALKPAGEVVEGCAKRAEAEITSMTDLGPYRHGIAQQVGKAVRDELRTRPAPTGDAVRESVIQDVIARFPGWRPTPAMLWFARACVSAALSADRTTIEAAALEQAATDFYNRDKWPRPDTSYIDGSQP